ncbi:hypothetical protein SEMRO_485_G152490.1 [Seminavis robusta]|uniref:Uncharacterized protein n=1 Tax=Seminavis robusta TaxID=568900 RepID=A0A9N8HGI0_9STRA|nr:hypothetical protein SEMRO_485_G152490.1 [Seminavis robusta]|eukprot:Sro485_g152490.1 n/a (292) ;mRNA; r:52766-53641
MPGWDNGSNWGSKEDKVRLMKAIWAADYNGHSLKPLFAEFLSQQVRCFNQKTLGENQTVVNGIFWNAGFRVKEEDEHDVLDWTLVPEKTIGGIWDYLVEHDATFFGGPKKKQKLEELEEEEEETLDWGTPVTSVAKKPPAVAMKPPAVAEKPPAVAEKPEIFINVLEAMHLKRERPIALGDDVFPGTKKPNVTETKKAAKRKEKLIKFCGDNNMNLDGSKRLFRDEIVRKTEDQDTIASAVYFNTYVIHNLRNGRYDLALQTAQKVQDTLSASTIDFNSSSPGFHLYTKSF